MRPDVRSALPSTPRPVDLLKNPPGTAPTAVPGTNAGCPPAHPSAQTLPPVIIQTQIHRRALEVVPNMYHTALPLATKRVTEPPRALHALAQLRTVSAASPPPSYPRAVLRGGQHPRHSGRCRERTGLCCIKGGLRFEPTYRAGQPSSDQRLNTSSPRAKNLEVRSTSSPISGCSGCPSQILWLDTEARSLN